MWLLIHIPVSVKPYQWKQDPNGNQHQAITRTTLLKISLATLDGQTVEFAVESKMQDALKVHGVQT